MLLFFAVLSSEPFVVRNFARRSWTSPSLTVTFFAAAASARRWFLISVVSDARSKSGLSACGASLVPAAARLALVAARTWATEMRVCPTVAAAPVCTGPHAVTATKAASADATAVVRGTLVLPERLSRHCRGRVSTLRHQGRSRGGCRAGVAEGWRLPART